MTAVSEPAQAGGSPFVNVKTIAAVIRKDMRTLWPLAAAVAAFWFFAAAFFREQSDFPNVVLDFGRTQLHVDGVLFVVTNLLRLVLSVTFVVMLVQQDKATDPRNDWMARPIRAGELVLAKTLVTFAVVLAPCILGAALGVATGRQDLDTAFNDLYGVVLGCAVFLALGWLCSSTLQAMLATMALAVLSVLLVSLSIGVSELREGGDFAAPMPPPPIPSPPQTARIETPQPAVAAIEQGSDWATTAPQTISLFVVTMAGAGVILWLLLRRRQVLAARLVFVCLFSATTLAFTYSVEVVDRVATIAPAASLEQRMAAFRKNDANGDLRLNKREYDNVLNDLGFAGQMETLWPQRDTNNDGFIDAEEMQPALGVLAPAATLEQRMTAFTQYDLDKDRRLTKDEYAAVLKVLGYSAQLESYWTQRDVDKDGFISLEEYLPAIQ